MSSQKFYSLMGFIIARLPMASMYIWPCVLIFLVMFTNYGILSLLYMYWMVLDRNTCSEGGRRYEFIRELGIWKTMAEYFPMKLVKTVDLDPSQNYLFCAHPHGLYALSCAINFSTEATGVSKLFPGIRAYMLPKDIQFLIPIHREFIQLMGMASSSVRSIKHLLNDPRGGNALGLCIGGVHEMLDAHPNNSTYRISLRRRKGFVRLALENGAPLVPVFSFGENELFDQLPNPKGSTLRKIQDFLLRTISLPVIMPRTLIPRKHAVTTVVGAPLPCEKIDNPTNEDIDQFHAKYVEALKELFYSNRSKYGEADREISIM